MALLLWCIKPSKSSGSINLCGVAEDKRPLPGVRLDPIVHLVGVRTFRRDAKAVVQCPLVCEGRDPRAERVTVAVVQPAEEEEFFASYFVDQTTEDMSNHFAPTEHCAGIDERRAHQPLPLLGRQSPAAPHLEASPPLK